jgi:2-keto-4-pentenoate hydratase
MTARAEAAAAILWQNWRDRGRIDELPAECRPADRAEGYRVQRTVVRLSGQSVAGWKIAATSAAGQKHIGVDGPLAGPILSQRLLEDGARISLEGNLMRVAEAEFAFAFGTDLPKRPSPYTRDEVRTAVTSLHPTIEIPDSRYQDFARVGAPQLIADTACSDWLAFGTAARADWRSRDLISHKVTMYRNGIPAASGSGANVLGDPLVALTWLVNELQTYGDGVRAGQFVTTGTCIIPAAVAPGDTIRADFGELGALEVSLS